LPISTVVGNKSLKEYLLGQYDDATKRKKDFPSLYSQNINGFKLDKKRGELTLIVDFIKIYQCDLVGFSELKLDVSKYKVRQILANTLGKLFDSCQCAMSNSEIPFEEFYKPGGTLTATFDHNPCRFHSKYSAKMGRWSTISLSGKHGHVIHFISVYQVVANSGTGLFTAHQQQVSSLRLEDRTLLPSPGFIQDLFAFLKSLQNPLAKIVIMGDLNEIVGHSLSSISKLTSEFELVDVMAHFHPLDKEVVTYARGST
jgi:hypothetical protein